MNDTSARLDSPSATPSGRRWLRIGLILAGIAVLLFVGVSFALSRFLDPERLAGWVEPRIEAAVNRDVEVGRVEVGFLPLGVRLQEVQVADPTGLSAGLARLESMEFRVKFLPLFRREVQVREIRLAGLVANLRVGPDGLTNYGDFSPETEAAAAVDTTDAPPFSLQLDRIRLLSGRVSFRDMEQGRSLLLDELEGESSVGRQADGPWTFDGAYEARLTADPTSAGADLSGATAGEPVAEAATEETGWLTDLPLRLEATVEADGDFGAVRITRGALSLDELVLALSGEARNLKDPVRTVELALQAQGVPLGQVLSLLPDSVVDRDQVEASGTLSADITVEGDVGPEQRPVIQGSVEVAGGQIIHGGRTLARSLDGTVTLGADRTVRPRFTGEVLGGAFRMDGTVGMDEPRSMDLATVANPDLSLLDPDLLPEGVTLQGLVPLDLRVVGDPSEPTSLGFWGSVAMRQFRGTHPALAVPVSIPTGNLTMEGTRASIEEMGVLLGDDRFVLTGALTSLTAFMDGGVPEFRGSARGSRFALLEVMSDPPADTALTYGRVAFARVGGRQVNGLSADDAAREMGLHRPVELPLAGELQVSVDTVIDRKGRMEDVEATLLFGPSFIQVTEARFRRYGGRVSTTADLEFGDDPEEPFSFTLSVEGVEAGAFLAETTPLGRFITGTLDLSLDVTGGLDDLLLPSRSSLQGRGAFSITGGGLDATALTERLATFLGQEALRSPRIRDWSTTFTLRDGQVHLNEAPMEGAPGSPRVAGGIGLDGALDLLASFEVPRQEMATSALERLGITGGGDLVNAILRIGGTVTDPSLRADPEASMDAVTDAVQERAREEIDEQIQEQREQLRDRATGFLRGLLDRRDTTTPPPPPDTLRPDTLAADSLLPDSLRRDTIPPDSVPPDTVRADTLRPDTVPPDTVPPDTVPPDTVPPDTVGVAAMARDIVPGGGAA